MSGDPFNEENYKTEILGNRAKNTLDFPTFMAGLIMADYKKTNCKKCHGLGAIAEECCDGRMCGCHGMPTNFEPCDCGVDFPTDKQIEIWSKDYDRK